MALNGISTQNTKQLKQEQKLEIAEAKTMCVAINVRKPSEEMKDFFNQFNETVKQFKKNNDNKETI